MKIPHILFHVDEIVLDLYRGDGELKNPKTFIENMNELPGGIKAARVVRNVVTIIGALFSRWF